MQKKRYRLYLIMALVVAFGGLGTALATDSSPQLGLDLEGGVSVILQATNPEGVRPDVLTRTVDIIRDRINSLGVAESEVTASGENILIQIPGVKDEQAALDVIGTTAQLTFRQVDEVITPNPNKKNQEVPEITEETGQEVNQEEVVYPSAQEGEEGVLYRLLPAGDLTGEIVERAEAVVDTQTGNQWSVSIEMNDEGAADWAEFTDKLACLRDEGEQVKSQVAIVLDGEVQSAAGMQDPATAGAGGGVECGQGITGGDTQINMGGQEEAKNLALVLTTGALPLSLEQQEVRTVSPTLGRSSLNAGLLAGAVGLLLVMIYVLVYYKALGLVVWLGLAVFSSVFYTIMALLGETVGLALTLAGVAGVIVSVGITADSYIVAFERLKDEIRTGKSMRAAVERGMQRAFKTILVANFVTFSAAIILFYLAVGPVKGFALTLGIATLVDVFVAYFFTRSAVNILARNPRFVEGRVFGLKAALGVRT